MLPIIHNHFLRIRRRHENRVLIFHRRMLRDHKATRYIINVLNPYLAEGMYSNSIPNYIKIFAALRFYATGSYQRDIGLSYNVSLSQSSVHRCIHQVTQVIEEVLAPNEVSFPKTQPEQNRIKEVFMQRFGFPWNNLC
ncbi:hypothetical protein NQ318_023521 [Aromia moschata]|uniref:Nuclease HARBI1 n=1 Tax=Aromia moschata TaxID=1265417 RepID=A0AAV8YNT6_9CUCU|nr:hypothetical protein NQ318_023521 [Aromia moschata]